MVLLLSSFAQYSVLYFHWVKYPLMERMPFRGAINDDNEKDISSHIPSFHKHITTLAESTG